MHLDGDALFVDDIYWEYRSSWAETSGKIPVAIDTRLEKISNRPICMAALPNGAPNNESKAPTALRSSPQMHGRSGRHP